ncbi:DNA polymerase III subunit delta [Mycoplasmopsis edwardii]|nr:DNA polymerase III subunit delta [Mycoplasmopsis edwardii]
MKEIYEKFNKLVQQNKLSHLYLLNAQKVTDVRSVIHNLILAINNIKENSFIHNEIDFNNLYSNIYYFDTSGQSIKKEDLLNFFDKVNTSSNNDFKYKIVIINNIENATTQSLNAILKEIEEPIENLCILFITKNIKQVLPTILSRSQIINLPEDEYSSIVKNFDINETNQFTPVALKLANTSLTLAKEFNKSDYQKLFNKYLKLLKNLNHKKGNPFSQLYISLNEDIIKDEWHTTIFTLNLIKWTILGLDNKNSTYIKNPFLDELKKTNQALMEGNKHLYNWVTYINEFLYNTSLNGNFRIQKEKMLLLMGEFYE